VFSLLVKTEIMGQNGYRKHTLTMNRHAFRPR
jgi:hypothetical protein